MSDQKKNHPKVQHYVPVFLLTNFSIEQKNQVYCYDKINERIFPSNVRNLASESGFYDLIDGDAESSLESQLADLEGRSAEIINGRILARGTIRGLSNEERRDLALFVAIQHLRTRNARMAIDKMYSDVAERIQRIGGDPDAVVGNPDFDREQNVKFQSVYNFGVARTLTPEILRKKWFLLRSDNAFWISDNPVVLQNEQDNSGVRGNLGFGVKGIEIYLPISAEFIMAFHCEQTFRDMEKYYEENINALDTAGAFLLRNYVVKIRRRMAIECDDENVTNLNSLQVMFAERFVFSAQPDFTLAKEMIDKEPHLQRGPRPEIV